MGIKTYGYRPTVAPPWYLPTVAGYTHSLVGQEFNEPLAVSGRLLSIGSWTGLEAAGNKSKKWAAYLTNVYNASGNYPKLGETNPATISVLYTNQAGGADYNAPINAASVSSGRLSESSHILLYVGDKLLLAGLDLASGGTKKTTLGRSYLVASGGTSVPVTAGSRFLQRHEGTDTLAASFIPTAPNGVLAANDKFALYALIEENRSPRLTFSSLLNPTSLGPGSTPAVVGGTSPSLSVTFSDTDRTAGYNDYPKEIIFTLYRWTGTEWEQGSEQSYQVGIHYTKPAAGTSDVVLSLPAPAGILAGSTYRVHARGKDELLVWSGQYANDASSWESQMEFTVAQGGYAESVTPLGRTIDLTPDFAATYQNAGGFAATNVKLRLLVRTGSGLFQVSQTSGLIAKAVAVGGALAVTWAETGFTTLLSSTDYAVEFQFTDSSGQVGQWVSRTDFHTNYKPLTPTQLSPANNTQTSNAPRITFTATDPDDTPVSTGGSLTGFVEITGPYLGNFTFDTDASGWTNDTNTVGTTTTRGRATDQVRTGAGSFKTDFTANTAAPGDSDIYSVLHPVVEGYTYAASAWRRLGAANLRGQVALSWYNASSVLISTSLGSLGTTALSAWEQSTVSAVAPAGATQMRIRLRATSLISGALGAVWFDDVAVSSGVRGVLTALKDTPASGWYAQTSISSNVAAAGQYSVRARMFDGDLYSLWSTPASFTMITGPEVDITYPAPLAALTTHRPTLTWVVTGDQNRYKVLVKDATTGASRLDTGFIASTTARAYTMPDAILKSVDDATAQVVVENAAMAVGYSAPVRFTVNYPQPAAPTNLSVQYELLPGDEYPSAIRLSWTPVDTSPTNLIGMEIWRMSDSNTSSLQLIATFTGFDPGTYLDRTPVSDVQHRYYVRQNILQAGAARYGAYAEIDAKLTIYATILEAVGGDIGDRLVMTFWGTKSKTLMQQQTLAVPAGGGDAVEHLGFGVGRSFSITWQVIGSQRHGGVSGLSARDQLQNLERIYDEQNVYSLRDGWGNLLFVRIVGDPVINYRNNGPVEADVTLTFRRVAYTAAELVDAN